MTAIDHFYFHDAATTVGGTLPVARQATVAPDVTAAGAATNRTMDGTIGVAQVSVAITTVATVSRQNNWQRRFVSPPLAAQTVAAGSWSYFLGFSQSDANSRVLAPGMWLAFWRPSTGAVVSANLFDNVGGTVGSALTVTAETGSGGGIGTPSPVTLVAGDVLIVEIFSANTQLAASAFTNTFFYDGTTEPTDTAAVASAASYLLAPTPITLQPAAQLFLPQGPQIRFS